MAKPFLPSSQPQGVEHEAKFGLTSPAVFADLDTRADFDGYIVGATNRVLQVDTYLDTPAHDLIRNGFVVRVRHSAAARRLGIKSLAAQRKGPVQTRLDVDAPLDAEANALDPSHWPDPIRRVVEDIGALEQSLHAIAVIRQDRRKRVISSAADARPVAEWSLDEVAVCHPDRDQTTLLTFQELEIEQLDTAQPDAYAALVAQVQALDGVTPHQESKLARALPPLLAALPDMPPDLTAELPLAEACRLILRTQWTQLLLTEHGVRDGSDPEYVHNARVAIRRARAALRLMGGHFRARVKRHHDRRLRTLGRVLGTVRDLDVALENLRLFRKTLPKGARKPLRPLRSELEAQRQVARQELLAHLDGKEHRAFITDFGEFCTTPGAGVRKSHRRPSDVAPHQVRHTMPGIILQGYEQVRAYEVAFADPDSLPLETFHALRIQAKYLRYSLEFARGLLGDDGAALIERLKELQDRLGELNDAHVEQLRLDAWTDAVADADAIALRRQAVDTTIATLREAIPPILARFVAQETRIRLALALANL